MACPWAKIKQPEPVSFEEIVSEEVAKDLQAKEDKRYLELMKNNDCSTSTKEEIAGEDIVSGVSSENSCDNDAMLARMLQMQFDKEYDDNLKKSEEKMNGGSKVSVSLENYRRAPLNYGKLYFLFVNKFVGVLAVILNKLTSIVDITNCHLILGN